MDTHSIINIFHILFVAPLFLWVGSQRSSIPEWVYWLLLTLGLVVTFYHGMKTVQKLKAYNPSVWVNAIHALLIGPLLLYLGIKKKDSLRGGYELLLLAGFGALGYHLFELAKYNT
jgi:membrane-bound metal-dependent hydrolase YbcI (DUF457 family)